MQELESDPRYRDARPAGDAPAAPVASSTTMNTKANAGALHWEDRACKGDYHPLEIFPIFRRAAPTFTRNIAYTFVWNCGLGLMFWLVAVLLSPRYNLNLQSFVWNLLISNAIGYVIHGLFALGAVLGLEARARGAGSVIKTLYYTAVSSTGVVAGFSIVAAFAADGTFINWLRNPQWVAMMALSSVLVSVILSTIFFWRERSARAEADVERQRVHTERVGREATLANLRALQAQIEPHFLFNTLANVTSLIDPDPAKARRMLESFIRFLRSSLDATREESTTLGDEAELMAAYLDVLEIRMGSRLRYEIDVPPALQGFALPPMLLQPVVENAIRHGLEPKMEGGVVRVRARRDAADVLVEISDSGVGFASTTRGGIGLTNLRDRLRLVYGERAALVVGESAGGGASVTLRLPA
jgi:signal transduction histidine kinase